MKNGSLQAIRQSLAAVGASLRECEKGPETQPVHHLRTGSRRCEAALDLLLRTDRDSVLAGPAADLHQLLKKIRHAAGPVRDLDVHRKLLKGIAACDVHGRPLGLLEPAAIGRDARRLDRWLSHRRKSKAAALAAHAVKWRKQLEKTASRLEEHMRSRRSFAPRELPAPATVALDVFIDLARRLPRLTAANLHDFRKGVKSARYIAEVDGRQTAAIAGLLKTIQDEIGEWHDWLVLSEEAKAALKDNHAPLTAWIGAERDRRFGLARKAAIEFREKLFREAHARQSGPRARRAA